MACRKILLPMTHPDKSIPLTSPESRDRPEAWLGSTSLLDLEDPKLRIRVLRTTQLATTEVNKAVAIHDYIKSMPFGCIAGFEHVRAGAVLRAGRGDCHTKGTLFVAMMRLAGIPARLKFVSLSSVFLQGIIDLPAGNIVIHAVGEVYLKNIWLQTDTYVTDTPLESSATLLLTRDKKSIGFGIHAQAQRFWGGETHAHAQYCEGDPSSMPRCDWGAAHDPELFYSGKGHEELQLGWITRLKWMVAAAVVNRRVAAMRLQAAAHHASY